MPRNEMFRIPATSKPFLRTEQKRLGLENISDVIRYAIFQLALTRKNDRQARFIIEGMFYEMKDKKLLRDWKLENGKSLPSYVFKDGDFK